MMLMGVSALKSSFGGLSTYMVCTHTFQKNLNQESNARTIVRSSDEADYKDNKQYKFLQGPFKYYVSKEVGGLGQKVAILADLQYYYADVGGWA